MSPLGLARLIIRWSETQGVRKKGKTGDTKQKQAKNVLALHSKSAFEFPSFPIFRSELHIVWITRGNLNL